MSTDLRPPTRRRRQVINVLALIVLPALAALAAVLWAAEGRHAFDAGEGSIEDVERRITSAGLQLCSTVDNPDGTANQAIRSRQYVVAESCGGDSGQLAVDEFEDVAHRDAAARNHEHQSRPRASGVAYTYGTTTVFVFGSSDDDIQNELDLILRAAGAR
ncbi:MAG TPA: hypothetical protein VIP75_01970 [Acidothermales bacterium]|nr:hypothetical protein [Actinomycetes bacterium]